MIEVQQELQTHMTGERFDLKYRKENHCEVRVDGPRYKEVSKAYFHVYVEINIFASINMTKKLYTMDIVQGKIQYAMTHAIPIYKLGNGTEDTGEQICCLTLLDNKNPKDAIETNNFGQIDPHVPLQQCALEGHYQMECDFS